MMEVTSARKAFPFNRAKAIELNIGCQIAFSHVT
jgi:hypothetical protein